MKLNPHKLQTRIKKKASESLCTYRVVGIAVDRKGRYIGIKTNVPRENLSDIYTNSYHAEERLIHSMSPLIISEILIARIGKSGDLRPINPCDRCKKLADKYGIKIRSIEELNYVC